MGTEIALLLTFGWTGVLLAMLGVPLWKRKVKPNKTYGFRIRKTLQDEALWYEVNCVVGRDLMWVGAGQAVLMVLLGIVRASPDVIAAVGLGWTTIGVSGFTFHGYRLASRAKS